MTMTMTPTFFGRSTVSPAAATSTSFVSSTRAPSPSYQTTPSPSHPPTPSPGHQRATPSPSNPQPTIGAGTPSNKRPTLAPNSSTTPTRRTPPLQQTLSLLKYPAQSLQIYQAPHLQHHHVKVTAVRTQGTLGSPQQATTLLNRRPEMEMVKTIKLKFLSRDPYTSSYIQI
jgi:hypothetical protein